MWLGVWVFVLLRVGEWEYLFFCGFARYVDIRQVERSSPTTGPGMGDMLARERTRRVPAPNVGRTAVRPLLSVTYQTQPEEAIPSAAAEKLDLSCARSPCSVRIMAPSMGDMPDSCAYGVDKGGFLVVVM